MPAKKKKYKATASLRWMPRPNNPRPGLVEEYLYLDLAQTCVMTGQVGELEKGKWWASVTYSTVGRSDLTNKEMARAFVEGAVEDLWHLETAKK